MKQVRFKAICLAIVLTLLFTSTIYPRIIRAADYPAKPITMIIAYAAGGIIDIQARGLIPYLEKELNTSIRIENVPGASGVIGANKAFKSPPDGYTLIMDLSPSIYTRALTNESSQYQPTEFVPVYSFARDVVVLFGHPEVFSKFDDFVKAARKRPVSIGNSGIGTPTELAYLALEKTLGVKFNIVPYGSGVLTVTAVAGKHIDGALTYTTTGMPLAKSGKIKPLLVFSSERNPDYPDVPTPKELDYDIAPMLSICGIWVPPKTPADKVRVLESALERAVKNPQYVEWRKKQPSEYIQLSAKAFKTEFDMQVKVADNFLKFRKSAK